MEGAEATPIEEFGFAWTEDKDGVTRFRRSGQPCVATYRDGMPRRWQHYGDTFEWRTLKPGAIVPSPVTNT